MQEISDRLEIEEVLAAYSEAVDTHNWDLLDRVFLPEADIDYREVIPYRGNLAYTKEWLSQMMPLADAYYHILGLPQVSTRGDAGRTKTPCLNPMPGRDGREDRRFVGHWYLDDWVRTPAGWRIRARRYSACYQATTESTGNGSAPSKAPLPASETLKIHELYARYNHAVDSGDTAAYIACFALGGRLVSGGAVRAGESALAEVASGCAKRRTKHFVSNVTVATTADGTACGRADVLILAGGGERPELLTYGGYDDLLRREANSWRFAERKFAAIV